jgi:FkbM family methyltransferase
MTFISYAQNFEDVMLNRALKHIDKGFYIDVGANDPIINSVSYAFYKQGWSGINIEPMSSYYERLCSTRPRDINLDIAVGDTDDELILYTIPDTGLSTIKKKIAQQQIEAGWAVQERKIPVRTLNQVLDEYVNGPIHFLKIDVEGAEKSVLQGLDLTRWRPWLLVIEATVPMSQELNFHSWESLLTGAEYEMVYFDGLNRFYVAQEHNNLAGAFEVPPNIFDDFFPHSDEYLSVRHEKLIIERDRIRTELDRTREEVKDLRADLEGVREDRDVIHSELKIVRDERDLIRTELDKVREDSAATRAKLKEVSENSYKIRLKLDGVRKERDDIRIKLNEIKADRDHVLTELNETRHDRDQIRKKLDEVWDDRHRYWSELNEIYNSLLWRLFAPLRALLRKVRLLRDRITKIYHRPFSQNIAKLLRRIEIKLRQTPWGGAFLERIRLGNPRLWDRVVNWIKRTDSTESNQELPIDNTSNNEHFSENESHYLALFRRELVQRQKNNKEH